MFPLSCMSYPQYVGLAITYDPFVYKILHLFGFTFLTSVVPYIQIEKEIMIYIGLVFQFQ